MIDLVMIELLRTTGAARRFLADPAPEWDDVAFATSNWLRLTPEELGQVAQEVIDVLVRWGNRAVPDDGEHREPVYVFSRGFPSQP